jgi:hypothetical protein
MRGWAAVAAVAGVLGAGAGEAQAFCGFFINGAGAKLYNDATMVVLMREGTRTVLAMQNSYKGPPEDFAMVVPVPVVLKEANVKTLPHTVFDRVDTLAAPRLVEYWEADPCTPRDLDGETTAAPGTATGAFVKRSSAKAKDLGVTIEAKFDVGEYKILILSAKDSMGLDTWLHAEGYKIPDGAEAVLRPYVAAGMKFFVAKVDVKKVAFGKDGVATLSPLRFHYDTPDFTLPVRLGLLSSAGTQDLLVHILARGTRYEVANYDNVTIPTNLEVADATRDEFGEVYAALFDATLAAHPGAVVTEYSWDANSCDPCPTPPLDGSDLMTLGADVSGGGAYGYVLTRLHARYTKGALGEDLVFRAAPPLYGGRGIPGPDGKTDTRVAAGAGAGTNNFQGRYIIAHRWKGVLACASPVRGMWGGPPVGGGGAGGGGARAATDLAFAPRRGLKLAGLVLDDVPDIGFRAAAVSGKGAGDGTGGGSGGGGGSSGKTAPKGKSKGKTKRFWPFTLWGALPGMLGLMGVLSARRARRRAPTDGVARQG